MTYVQGIQTITGYHHWPSLRQPDVFITNSKFPWGLTSQEVISDDSVSLLHNMEN